MARGSILAVVTFAFGCYEPNLPAVPFACQSSRECPDGYYCAPNEPICIANGTVDNNFLLSESTQASEPPRPVWNSASLRFGVFWTLSSLDSSSQPGLWMTEFEKVQADVQNLGQYLVESTGQSTVGFNVLFDASYSGYVYGEALKDDDGTHLRVKSLASPTVAPLTLFEDPNSDPSAIGFSAPSLAVRPDGELDVTYTYGNPPVIYENNLYYTPIPLPDEMPPQPRYLNNSLATDALVAAPDDLTTILFWRDSTGAVFQTSSASSTQNPLSGIRNISRIAVIYGQVVLVEQQGTSSTSEWIITTLDQTPLTGIPLSEGVPDLIATDTGLAVCTFDSQNGLLYYFFSVNLNGDLLTLGAVGAPKQVKRYSTAPISSCRLAYSSEGNVLAVAWQETIPPSQTDNSPSLFRNYVQAIDLSK